MPLTKPIAKNMLNIMPRTSGTSTRVALNELVKFASEDDQAQYQRLTNDTVGAVFTAQKPQFIAWCDQAFGAGIVMNLFDSPPRDGIIQPVQALVDIAALRAIAGEINSPEAGI